MSLRIAFSGFKRSNMGCAVLEGGRSADFHEFCFQAAKRSEMCRAVMKGLRFANTQQSCFEA